MTTETAAKKDTQKLQKAIIDGLEDVKGHDIQVFNTEHLSPLFERVIVASGTSNRQTRALASSVVDSVREAGFPKPRIEGQENGEWIIVDCGAAVAHIMQPAIREYYHLEELWGEKPIRLRLGAAKPPVPVKEVAPPAKKVLTSLRRTSAAKTAARDADRERAAEKKKPARKPAAKGAPARGAAGRGAAAKSAAARGAPAKSAPVKSAPVKAAPAKAAPAKAAPAKAAPAKKAGASSTARTAAGKVALKTAAKKAPAKKAPAKSPARKA